jgi:DNA-binding response OmpR family regulator
VNWKKEADSQSSFLIKLWHNMKSILVIDDHPDIRDNTAEILELAGYKVFTAENGKKGIERAVKEKPDLVICDIMMPELDGYGVLHLMRKNPDTALIPFIFLTAKTERTDLRKGMEMGADDYIPKPFEEIELLNAVETRLKKKEILDQKYASGLTGVNQFFQDIRETGLLEQITEKYEMIALSKKQMLYREGRRPRFLYYLSKGKIKGFKSHEDGKEYITDLYSAGDFIGYTSIIADKDYDDNTIVLEEAELLQVPREDFLKMIYGDINIAVKFIEMITRNVKDKEERLVALAYSSLRKRVANALVDIHEKFRSDENSNRLFEISREDIAQYVGTATESLIRTHSDFKAEKLIEITGGKITIPDLGKLKKMLY